MFKEKKKVINIYSIMNYLMIQVNFKLTANLLWSFTV